MPVTMVKNNQAGPTVMASDPKGTVYVEWQGKGDPNGGDYQPVPEVIAESVAFSKAVRKGVLSIVNEAEAEHAFGLQTADFTNRTEVAAIEAASLVDHRANNDILVTTCVGPSPRGEGKCGIDVTVKEIDQGKKPPLCSQHLDLASQYVPEDTQVDGRHVVQWTRVTMGPRQTQ